MSTTAPAVELATFDATVMASLYQHRLLTTSQICVLHDPHSHRRWTQKRLRRLEHKGYLARVAGRPPAREARWFVTGLGAALAETGGAVRPREFRMDSHRAAAARHLLAVNDVGVALTRAARRHGDEFDHRHWHHEIAHPHGPATREVIIPDAVLAYDVWEPGGVCSEWRFLEVDRGTESVHTLIDKLRAYAALYHYAPPRRRTTAHQPKIGWKRRYAVFPGVMLVFADLDEPTAARRISSLAGFYTSDPTLGAADKLRVTATTLTELADHGPFAPIFQRIPTLERVPLHRRQR